MPGDDGDTPIAHGVEGLRGLRDRAAPQEVDAAFEALRGDARNLRRLVERARRPDTAARLDEHLRALDDVGAALRDDLAATITPVLDELEAVRGVRHVSSHDAGHTGVLKDPPPGSVIVVDETYVYTTDDLGRVVRAQATLVLRPPGRRKAHQQRTLPGKEPDDDAGHLFAASLGGIGDHLNLTPMDRKLNRSDFASVENVWRRAIRGHKSVEVTIDLRYRDDGNRPGVLLVTYKIEGQKARRLRLPNRLPGDTT